MSSKLLVYGSPYGSFNGTVKVSGAKNAALPLLAAAILTKDLVELKSIPRLADIACMVTLISSLGSEVSFGQEDSVTISSKHLSLSAPSIWAKKIRASILLLGPMLARYGSIELAMPGGCDIGLRPIMEHIAGLKALGADIEISNNKVTAKTSGLKGAYIKMQSVSVGATENIIMAAVLAEGETVIENAACEPEISDLINMLNKMGAKISGLGTNRICISGVASLSGIEYSVMPDRIEAGTFLIAATAARGNITLKNYNPGDIEILLKYLSQAGAKIDYNGSDLSLIMDSRPEAVSIETAVYPGFPTDLQAQWVALSAISKGKCKITENIFDDRFHHIAELTKMGANISKNSNYIEVIGVESLNSAVVSGSDLRATAGLVIAANTAVGQSEIINAHNIDRGYESFDLKLGSCGVIMQRVV